jgi:penicillin-binding protein 2
VAGKTGTAQVISLSGARAMAGKMDVRHHGWFVFFAPRDNPKVAGVVFGEHAEHGSSAAPIAKYALETYFAKLDGQPLPRLVPLPPSAADTADDPIVTPQPAPAPASAATPPGGRGGQPQRP